MTPVADFETVSFAGYTWNPGHPPPSTYKEHLRPAPCELGYWESLPGFSSQKRSIAAVGTRVYVEHPTFSPQLLAYDLTPWFGGSTAVQWELGQSFDCLVPLFEHVERGGFLESHNAEFEREVWNYFCVPKWNWPRLRIEQQRCSAVKARAAGYPGKLENLTDVLDTKIKKDPEGARLMKVFSIPRNPSKKDPRVLTLPSEAPAEWARYKSYNLTDIGSEFEASTMLPEFPEVEQRRWVLDQQINDRGMAVDSKRIADCIAIVEQAYERFGSEFRALTGGIEPTELKQLQGWLAGRSVHMYDMQEKTIDEAVERLAVPEYMVGGEVPPPLRALQIRQMLGSAGVKKLYALRAQTASDGRVHGMYMMHATHHGRTGGYGPQPTNLYKGEWHTPEEVDAALRVIATRSLDAVKAAYPTLGPLEVVNNCLRSLFVAGPGMQLVSSDYSAIEGVVLAALAGEQWILDVFNTHGMLYEAQISRMTGVAFEEFVRYKRETGKHHPLRQQGKLAVLSGGFGSWIDGWKQFGADEYYNDDAEIKAAILSYRESVPAIVEFWGGQTRNKFRAGCRKEFYGLEGAAVAAIENPGNSYRVGRISLQVGGDDCLYMVLPSGRFIRYHTPRLRPSTRNYAESWEQEISYWGWNTNPKKGPPAWIQMDLYGGVLTQNATGGTARDIMMHGMENVNADGYPIVMHTYDEAVAEVPIGWGDIEEFEAGLNELPDYAKDWPIRVKGGWVGPRYGKWD